MTKLKPYHNFKASIFVYSEYVGLEYQEMLVTLGKYTNEGYRRFTSHIIVIISNYHCYILYRKGPEPNTRKLDVHVKELESYDGQILKDMVMKGNNEYIEHNSSGLNASILHFRAGVQPNSE